MKRFLIISSFVFLLSFAAAAQQKRPQTETEIIALREKIAEAISKNDRKFLTQVFADDFIHTHAVGRVEGKNRRLDGLLDGGANIESVAPIEISVRVFSKNMAIASGKTKITANEKDVFYQWTAVYFKQKGKWLVAATQATITQAEK